MVTLKGLLLSPTFLIDEETRFHTTEALRLRCDEIRVIPIRAKPCLVDDHPVRAIETLPRSGRVLVKGGLEQALNEITSDLLVIVEELRRRRRFSSSTDAPTRHHRADPSAPDPPRGEPPTPQYPDDRTRYLSWSLEDTRRRRQQLLSVGGNAKQLDSEILALRREIREGGQLRAGDSLEGGRYLLLNRIGRGGFGSVWDAYDRATESQVAIKVLHPEESLHAGNRDRFFRGARAMASLENRAVVKVLTTHGEDGGYYYFVMELVQGGDFRNAVLEKRIPPERVAAFLLPVAEALALAHSRGIVHRDVKPSNILVPSSDCPKLTDFDLVGGLDTTGGTRTGALGTYVYAAPEQLRNAKAVGSAADVYGFGATLLFGILGEEPFVPDIRRLVPELQCSSALQSIILRSIAWTAEERFPSAVELCGELRGTTQ